MVELDNPEEISLYFHVPFCSKKCPYCHFFVLPDREPAKLLYMEALELEWKRVAAYLYNKTISSIYFGGGTPYLIGAGAIERILSWVDALFPLRNTVEVTLEANPEEITAEGIESFRSAGINRLSIGVQSFDDALLRTLGRQHSATMALTAIDSAVNAGIDNISIDLMYELPGQTVVEWRNSLNYLAKLPITHLSTYNLTIEPRTPYFKRRSALRRQIPDEKTCLTLYSLLLESCQSAGMTRYEISAFCKEGFASKHNTGYWTARPFLGLGPSAFSYWNGRRFRNIDNLQKYAQRLKGGQSGVDFDEKLDQLAHRRELLAIQLRLCEGVDLSGFQNRHGPLEVETLEVLNSLVEEGLLMITSLPSPRIALTDRGLLLYDAIAAEII